ncbi:MAG: hypothetical protein OSA99_16195 [Acidimicrobiales bacterium]|nr:hypothetical protein [Acidimicrobiales bacterium]
MFQQRKRRGWPVVVAFAAAFGGVTFALADTVLDIADEPPERPTAPLHDDDTSTTIASHPAH